MLVKMKKVYYCEYCGRHRLTSYSIKEHEKRCTLNPHRTCGMCGRSDLTPILEKYEDRFVIEENPAKYGGTRLIWIHGEVTIEEIEKDTEHCPACTLAVLRICGLAKWPSPIDFDYHKSRVKWWKEANAAQAENGYY